MRAVWRGLVLAALAVGCSRAAPEPRAAPPSGDAADVVCLGYADVEGGVAELRPERPGRVVQVFVEEGAEVKDRQELFRLDDAEARQQVARARASLKAAEGREALAKQEAAQQPQRLKQLAATLEATTARLAGARIALKRQEDLYSRNLVTKPEVDQAREAVRELEASVEAAKAKRSEAEAVDPKVAAEVAAAEAEAARAALKQTEDALDRCTVRAPSAGRVLVLAARPGEVVGAGGAAPVQFQPDRPFVVRAEVEQELVSRVTPGLLAMVSDEMAGAGPWKGSVARVGGMYSRRRHRTDPTQFVDVPTVECLVRLESGHPPLRVGQKLRVSIYGKPPGQ
jgi:multidrug resistance efflux pump